MRLIRVLIADDDPRVLASLRMLVDSESDMEVVAEAGDGVEASELAVRLRPDVLLLDVQMPRRSGLDVLREVGESLPDPRVVMLTTFDSEEYAYQALRSGAAGFLLKNSRPAEVLSAIRVADAGNALLAPEITRRLIDRFHARRSDPRLSALTARERDTLVLVGRGLTNHEIATSMFVTVTTARTYVSRVMTKLQVRERAGLVVFAYENGLVGPGSPPIP